MTWCWSSCSIKHGDTQRGFVCTYITEDLLSFSHSAQLWAVAVWVEHGLFFIPVLSVEFLQQ